MVNKFSTLFSECEILGQNFGVPWCCGQVNSSDRNLNKTFFRNTKCWMSLRSKSIQGMNSSILKVFEPKFSIFTQLQHASYSRILHIMLIFCCKVTFEKSYMLHDEKDTNFVFHFFVAKFLDNIVVLDTNAFQVFATISFTFRPFFSQNIFQNPQIRFHETKISI